MKNQFKNLHRIFLFTAVLFISCSKGGHDYSEDDWFPPMHVDHGNLVLTFKIGSDTANYWSKYTTAKVTIDNNTKELFIKGDSTFTLSWYMHKNDSIAAGNYQLLGNVASYNQHYQSTTINLTITEHKNGKLNGSFQGTFKDLYTGQLVQVKDGKIIDLTVKY